MATKNGFPQPIDPVSKFARRVGSHRRDLGGNSLEGEYSGDGLAMKGSGERGATRRAADRMTSFDAGPQTPGISSLRDWNSHLRQFAPARTPTGTPSATAAPVRPRPLGAIVAPAGTVSTPFASNAPAHAYHGGEPTPGYGATPAGTPSASETPGMPPTSHPFLRPEDVALGKAYGLGSQSGGHELSREEHGYEQQQPQYHSIRLLGGGAMEMTGPWGTVSTRPVGSVVAPGIPTPARGVATAEDLPHGGISGTMPVTSKGEVSGSLAGNFPQPAPPTAATQAGSSARAALGEGYEAAQRLPFSPRAIARGAVLAGQAVTDAARGFAGFPQPTRDPAGPFPNQPSLADLPAATAPRPQPVQAPQVQPTSLAKTGFPTPSAPPAADPALAPTPVAPTPADPMDVFNRYANSDSNYLKKLRKGQ